MYLGFVFEVLLSWPHFFVSSASSSGAATYRKCCCCDGCLIDFTVGAAAVVRCRLRLIIRHDIYVL